jgi:hypothetical protein
MLVAWNATRQAARAVHDAMPFLEEASKVTALTINADKDPAADLARTLRGTECRPRPPRSSPTTWRWGGLLSRAADLAADLMVMGAYGHSRLREPVSNVPA